MAAETVYDYYYGDESSQFSFYRIPPPSSSQENVSNGYPRMPSCCMACCWTVWACPQKTAGTISRDVSISTTPWMKFRRT